VLDGSAVAERYFLGSQDDPHDDHHFPALESDSEYVGRLGPGGLPDKNGAWPRASAQWRTRSSAPPVSCCSSRRSTTTVSFCLACLQLPSSTRAGFSGSHDTPSSRRSPTRNAGNGRRAAAWPERQTVRCTVRSGRSASGPRPPCVGKAIGVAVTARHLEDLAFRRAIGAPPDDRTWQWDGCVVPLSSSTRRQHRPARRQTPRRSGPPLEGSRRRIARRGRAARRPPPRSAPLLAENGNLL